MEGKTNLYVTHENYTTNIIPCNSGSGDSNMPDTHNEVNDQENRCLAGIHAAGGGIGDQKSAESYMQSAADYNCHGSKHVHKPIRRENESNVDRKELFGNIQRLPPIQRLDSKEGTNLSINMFRIDINKDMQSNNRYGDDTDVMGKERKSNAKRRLMTHSTTSKVVQHKQDDTCILETEKENTNMGSGTDGGINNNNSEVVSNRTLRKKISMFSPRNSSQTKSALTRHNSSNWKGEKNPIGYLPTYRLHPDPKDRFSPALVRKVIEAIAEPLLLKFNYSGNDAGNLIKRLSTNITRRLALTARRYRLVCSVFLVHLCEQTACIADRSLWSKDTDSVAVYKHHGRTFVCVITVHGLYKE